MSFGFSVGDFLAVGNLIKDICSCLQDARGSKAGYQELLRELECLQQALHHLDRLQNSGSHSMNLESIKYAALSCRRPLEQFLGKIRKYDTSLGVWGKDGIIKSTAGKLRWGLSERDEVCKLQSYLNIHIGTINILLAEHGLEKMDVASDKASADQLDIRESLDNTHDMVKKISGCLAVQALVVQNTQNNLAWLCDIISGELRTSWRSLTEMVAKVCVSTQQTYAMMLEIKSSLAGLDTRWTFFQAPLAVEDALGCKFPVPSEYDFDLLDAIIKHRFKAGPGSLDIQAGNYEYFNTKNSNNVLSRTSQLLPGTAITMAVIVTRPTLTDETCPMPKCCSIQTAEAAGGGRTCCTCNVWFSPTGKKRKSLHDLLSAIPAVSSSLANNYEPNDNTRACKRTKLASVKEDMIVFKNVRLSREEIPAEPLKSLGLPNRFGHGFFDLNTSNPASHVQASPRSDTTPDSGTNDTPESPFPPEQDDEISGLLKREPIEFDDAYDYVERIKRRFRSQPKIYKQFVGILRTYERGSTPLQEVYAQVTSLLSQAPDLVEEFDRFLPETAAWASSQTEKAAPASSQSETAARASSRTETAAPASSQSDTATRASSQPGPVLDDALNYLDKIKRRFHSQLNIYQQFLNILETFKQGSTSALEVYAQVTSLLNQAPDLVEEFEQFLPETATRVSSRIEKATPASSQSETAAQASSQPGPVLDDALNYLDKINCRFHSQPDIYEQFLEIFKTFKRGSTSALEVYAQVTNLLSQAPDLVEEFEQFLPETTPASL
ncbi:MAG: hypothetical protein M1821_004552 [Bathelium mastoideum]|nr:MAG: hypothetical protein M1821_004552 [Bathelium mastoideum]